MIGCPRRRRPLRFLLAAGLWVGLAAEAAAQGSVVTDRAALEALYDATGGPGWTENTNWKTSAPLGEWFGVTTDAAGRVTRLLLHANGLAGRIPAALGNLGELRLLLLQSGALTGPIPAELGRLANLQLLDFEGNDLTGPIPAELGNLASLERLDLARNNLTGSIPVELGSLVNLDGLSLHSNDLTGPVPARLGDLTRLRGLNLGFNPLTGPIPAELGDLRNLEGLGLGYTGLTGPIPAELGGLRNLETLRLTYAWGLSGSLPPGLQMAPLDRLDIFMTQVCAPPAWRDWLATIDFRGRVCGPGTGVTIDVAVFYTPAARVAAGGAAAIAAVIDLMVAETNQIHAASGVHHRVRLVERSEVAYNETGGGFIDLRRLRDPSDGHMDEVHAVRDRVGADLVHLIVGESDSAGRARILDAFGLTHHRAGGLTFAHELGHNQGLWHDRYEARHDVRYRWERDIPMHGYVNQPGLVAGAAQSRRWYTVMAYRDQCRDAGISCRQLHRFSNPRQSYNGDPLGVPDGTEVTSTTGPADAVTVLNVTGPVVARWRDRPAGANRPPASTETLPNRRLEHRGALEVDVSAAFVDPDGDPLTYTALSLAPEVVTARAAGARVTLTSVSAGTAEIWVTATDPDGLSATQTFMVWVDPPANRPPEPVGSLAPLTIGVDEPAVFVEVGSAFRDPDGDVLTYRAVSSSPAVASVAVSGRGVMVTPVSEGSSTVTVTATDAGGSNGTASQTFAVTVGPAVNRPPEAVGVLEEVTVGVDEAPVMVEVSGAFRDPDGDALTYGAASSSPSIASVAVVGSTVTVTPLSEGVATVTVTATDAGGSNGTASQTFAVTVGPPANRPPEAVGVLPAVTLGVDEAPVMVEVSGAFRDPDGDALTYGAASSSPSIASVAVVGSTVTVTPLSEGVATVTVTATDAGGSNGTASQTFAVTVGPPANRPPEAVGVLPPVTLGVDDSSATVDVGSAFRDPDGDVLTYRAVSSSPAVASVVVSGRGVMVTPVSEGSSTVTVTATDAGGSNGTASQTFAVTVGPPANRPPEAVGVLPPVTLGVDDSSATVDVGSAFRDPDGDVLTYRAVSSSPAVASVVVSGRGVMVTPVSEGSSTVTVTATDAGGSNGTASQTFAVTVSPPANRPPEAVGVLPPVTLGVDEAPVMVEVSGAFRDPDGDALTYGAASSSPSIASVAVVGSTVTVTPLSEGVATVTVTATDAGGSNGTASQTFAVTVGPPANRPPEAVGVLEEVTVGVDEASVAVEVGGAFRDPDGDALTYGATSSAIQVVTVRAAGARVTLTAVGAGTATIEVTATDPDGLSAMQSFRVRVTAPFTDDPIVSGVTPVRAVHFTELLARIDVLRSEAGLAQFRWTDPELRAGVTRVRRVHLVELREALAEAYSAAGRASPRWTDASPVLGSTTPIRALHVTELRVAVLALE